MAEAVEPDHRKTVPCWAWLSSALGVYTAINVLAFGPMEQRAAEAAGNSGTPLSALVSTGFTFAVFWFVGLVSISLCWRRKGMARLAVLLWPFAMLAIPDVLRAAPTLLTWLACIIGGIFVAAMLAGPEPREA
jgi:hypothetical protein